MQFFETHVLLKDVAADNAYRHHQKISRFMNTQGIVDYSYHGIDNPALPESSIIKVRTTSPLTPDGSLPSGTSVPVELDVAAGQVVTFRCRCTYRAPGDSTDRTASPADIDSRIPFMLARGGMSLLNSAQTGYRKIKIQRSLKRKERASDFHIHTYEYSIIAQVDDAALLDAAMISGLGTCRSFGLGMIRHLEVLL